MLLKALQNYITPQVTPTKTYPDVNLLNQILYGQFTASTLVVWYDANQQTFIDKGYKGNALVYSIIRKIAEKGKQCPTYVYKETEASKRFRSGKYSTKELNRLQRERDAWVLDPEYAKMARLVTLRGFKRIGDRQSK